MKKYWYQAKLLFMEKQGKQFFALRSYIIFKENSFDNAKKRAEKIGEKTPYPYQLSSKIEFNFLGLENLWTCYSEPRDGAMLSVFKDNGNKWEDALKHIKPISQYEINLFRYSPINLYLANLVYFVKENRHAKKGKVTTCEVLFKSKNKTDILSKIYQIAVNNNTLKDVVKIRRDCKKNFVSEFVGIEEIIPVFYSIKDGVELNRTVERFKNKSALLNVLERM